MYPRSGFFRTNWNDRFEAIRSQSLAAYAGVQPPSKHIAMHRDVTVIRAWPTAVGPAVQTSQR